MREASKTSAMIKSLLLSYLSLLITLATAENYFSAHSTKTQPAAPILTGSGE